MAATSTLQSNVQSAGMIKAIQVGTISGLFGGAVFGVQMTVGGMLPMVASMIGSSDIVVGFIVHLLISAIIGATFGIVVDRLPQTLITQFSVGVVWGIVWWILGALIIMPLVLGMGEMVLQIGEMQWMSFIGHVIFGIVMGVSYSTLYDKAG